MLGVSNPLDVEWVTGKGERVRLSCHPKMIALWKKEVESHGSSIFERESDGEEKNKKIAKLEHLIGRLTIENGFLESVLGRNTGA